METASRIALEGVASLPEALKLQPSIVTAFFEGKAFGDHRKFQEAEGKVRVAVVDRLNGVIRAIGVLAKSLSTRRG